MQKYKPKRISSKRRNINELIADETQTRVGSRHVWLWVAIEPKHRQIIQAEISFERNMLVAERFMPHLMDTYGKHPASTDGGTWYPQACRLLRVEHHIHSTHEKSIIERVVQHIKDGTESFDDCFPCKKNKCDLGHVKQWLDPFIDLHNGEVTP